MFAKPFWYFNTIESISHLNVLCVEGFLPSIASYKMERVRQTLALIQFPFVCMRHEAASVGRSVRGNEDWKSNFHKHHTFLLSTVHRYKVLLCEGYMVMVVV